MKFFSHFQLNDEDIRAWLYSCRFYYIFPDMPHLRTIPRFRSQDQSKSNATSAPNAGQLNKEMIDSLNSKWYIKISESERF